MKRWKQIYKVKYYVFSRTFFRLASEMTNNTSAVLSISKSHKQNWFWTSFQDGRVALFECGPTSTTPPQMKCELSGPDCDAVYKVVECPHTKQVFTCCRDVKIRKYLVDFDSLWYLFLLSKHFLFFLLFFFIEILFNFFFVYLFLLDYIDVAQYLIYLYLQTNNKNML